MSTNERFFQTLFEPEEQICVSETIYGTSLHEVLSRPLKPTEEFFAINPLHTKRADSNVTCLRNILVEIDGMEFKEQLHILCAIPHSTIVWSGGKSYHAIISLENPMPHRAAYDALVRQIYAKVPMADKSVKNPSRFSRVPGALRDGKREQTLHHVLDRVSDSRLREWLGPEVIENLKTEQPRVVQLRKIPSGFTNHFLGFGARPGERNAKLFTAACDLARCGWTEDEVLEKAAQVLDLPTHEMISCIKSAFKKVRD